MGWLDRLVSMVRGERGTAGAPLLEGRADGSWGEAFGGPVGAGSVARADSSVYNPFTFLGLSNYDKGAGSRPNPWETGLTDDDLRILYRYNGLARKIVDTFGTYAVRKGWEVPGIDDLDPEYKRLRIWKRTRTAMQMADLYGGSGVLLVTEDDVPRSFAGDPLAWLREPLNLERIGKLHAIHTLDAFQAVPMEFDRDIISTRYGQPSMWSITADGVRGMVHGSRVVYFGGRPLPPSERSGGSWKGNRMPDDSRLQAIWDEIRRLADTMNGAAILAQEIRESVLKVGNYTARKTGDEASSVDTKIANIAKGKALTGMVILGPQDEYENRSNPPTGFRDLSDPAKSMLAAASTIPEMILFGDSPSGLNTDGEASWEGFRQTISDYQEQHRESIEEIHTAILAAQDGPTRGEVPDGWDVAFLPLDEPSLEKRAQIRKTVAETDKILIDAGILAPEQITEARYGEEGWTFELPPMELPDTDAVLEEAMAAARAELAAQQPPPGTPPPGGEGEAPSNRPPEAEADPAAEPNADREDASTGTVVWFHAPEPKLRPAVERITGPLEGGGDPHVTVLYLGEVDPAALPEIAAAVEEERAALDEPIATMTGITVRPFPHGPDGTPVVVELGGSWYGEELHNRLLRRLAHLVNARQHDRYRPHVTLGYARDPLSPDAVAALLEVDATGYVVPLIVLEVKAGEQRISLPISVGGE